MSRQIDRGERVRGILSWSEDEGVEAWRLLLADTGKIFEYYRLWVLTITPNCCLMREANLQMYNLIVQVGKLGYLFTST